MAHKRKVRVAFCLDSFSIGGTELNAVRTAEALDPERVELIILHLQTTGPLRSRYERLGVRMIHLPISSLYSPRTILQGYRVAKLLRRWKVDVVHTHDIYTNIFFVPWARLFSSCSIIASRRWWYLAPRPELVAVNRWSCKLAHRILANSSEVAGLLESEEEVPAKRIVVIPNFLGESAFATVDEATRSAQLRDWGVPEGSIVIGIVARLQPVKNHVLILSALAELSYKFHVIVIGDGPMRAELEAMAARLNVVDRVHFVGELISAQNLHQYFDISVLCSLSEGFPNSLIEAMAAARVVVATPVGGVTEAVTDGENGMLVPVDSPERLAKALLELEADPSLRSRFGNAGQIVAREKFSQDVVISKLCGLYEALANG